MVSDFETELIRQARRADEELIATVAHAFAASKIRASLEPTIVDYWGEFTSTDPNYPRLLDIAAKIGCHVIRTGEPEAEGSDLRFVVSDVDLRLTEGETSVGVTADVSVWPEFSTPPGAITIPDRGMSPDQQGKAMSNTYTSFYLRRINEGPDAPETPQEQEFLDHILCSGVASFTAMNILIEPRSPLGESMRMCRTTVYGPSAAFVDQDKVNNGSLKIVTMDELVEQSARSAVRNNRVTTHVTVQGESTGHTRRDQPQVICTTTDDLDGVCHDILDHLGLGRKRLFNKWRVDQARAINQLGVLMSSSLMADGTE